MCIKALSAALSSFQNDPHIVMFDLPQHALLDRGSGQQPLAIFA
jgi:hypothetical protein